MIMPPLGTRPDPIHSLSDEILMGPIGNSLPSLADRPEDDRQLRRSHRADLVFDAAGALAMGGLAGTLIYVLLG